MEDKVIAKKGDKVRCVGIKGDAFITAGNYYTLSEDWIKSKDSVRVIDNCGYSTSWGAVYFEPVEETNTQAHYKGKDSLYKFCEEWGLNAYEFDILKRVVRCRHKGEFRKDLEKTKDLIDIYLKEYGG